MNNRDKLVFRTADKNVAIVFNALGLVSDIEVVEINMRPIVNFIFDLEKNGITQEVYKRAKAEVDYLVSHNIK